MYIYVNFNGNDGWVNSLMSCIFAFDGLVGQAGTLAMRRSALLAQDDSKPT